MRARRWRSRGCRRRGTEAVRHAADRRLHESFPLISSCTLHPPPSTHHPAIGCPLHGSHSPSPHVVPSAGYQYRLCPADAELTEACFQSHPVPFADGLSKLRWGGACGEELVFNATDVSVGTLPKGSTWRRGPFPRGPWEVAAAAFESATLPGSPLLVHGSRTCAPLPTVVQLGRVLRAGVRRAHRVPQRAHATADSAGPRSLGGHLPVQVQRQRRWRSLQGRGHGQADPAGGPCAGRVGPRVST